MGTVPELGTHHLFPSFARCRGMRDRYYVVGDPKVLRPGERVADTLTIEAVEGCAGVLGGVAVGLVVGVLLGYAVGGVAGVIGLAVVGMIVGVAAVVAIRYLRAEQRRSRAAGKVLRIDPQEPEVWSFCEVVGRLAATQAWTSGLVDHDRVVPPLLWWVVTAYRELEPLEADLAEARARPGLADVVEQKSQQIATIRGELDAVRHRLEQMIGPSRELDAREQARRDEESSRRKESELRERLTGAPVPAADYVVDAGETVEGVRAAAAALNELLAETHRMTSQLPDHRK
ncbi:hypothetical protein [Pseudonocardia nigra]|uniref:hypothetical protein n=1 Tax=Pseudonocardia nigra TaxID=1921578 RepID=UPI001C5D7274|nr:hypothetical protein [Pseudonocardia nigra]